MTEPTAPPVCYRHTDREAHIVCQRCGRPICPDCMRDAAVGFQCPTCIKEGARETRSGRTTYGGKAVRNPGALTYGLIGVNVVVWIALIASGVGPTGGGSSRLLDLLALRPNGLCVLGDGGYEVGAQLCQAQGGRVLPGVADGAWWQLVTSMFVHVQLWHIAANMFALYALGPELERWLGRARFAALYAISGLAGSALVMWAAPEYQLTLGASGAIFGLLGAVLLIAYKMKGNYQQVLMLIGINVVITFVVPNISWQAHLGGFLAGALVAAALVYAPRQRRTAFQVAALGTVGAAVLASIVLRLVLLA